MPYWLIMINPLCQVAKEGIDEITPTVANSVGDIAGSVAEGIFRGVKKGKE